MTQFTQLPSGEKNQLTPIEKLVYVYLRRYMNEETKESFPSQERLAKDSGLSRSTIIKSIKSLIDLEYIEKVYSPTRVTHYRFKKLLHFEPFSYEFLDNKDIKPLDKAYIIASQEHMFKNEEGKGKMLYTNRELSELINMPQATISKCNRSLVGDKILSLATDNNGEVVKTFNLSKVGQAIIWTLQKHEDDIDSLKKDNEYLHKKIDELEKQLNKQQALVL